MGEFLNHFINLVQNYGIIGLIALAFAEASFFPIPPDILLIPMAFMQRDLAIIYALITTIASVLGGMFGHVIGRRLGKPVLRKFFSAQKISSVEKYFAKYGGWGVAIAGFTPIPYKIFTIAAGAFNVSMPVFILSSIVGRGARFLLEGAFIYLLGDTAKYYLTNYFELITIIVSVICGILYLIWREVRRRDIVKATGTVVFIKKKYHQAYSSILRYRTFDKAAFYFFTNIMLSIMSVFIFLELIQDYFTVGSWSFDQIIYGYLHNMSSQSMDSFFKVITMTGNTLPVLIATLVVCVYFLIKSKIKHSAFFGLNILGIWIFNDILKNIVERPRPIGIKLVEASGYSFPSGHAMVPLVFAMLIVYYILTYCKNNKKTYIGCTFIILYALLIGISRVYVGVHYFSDVIAGWLAGILWASTSIVIHRLFAYKKSLSQNSRKY